MSERPGLKSALRRAREVLSAPFEVRFGPLDARREHRRTLDGLPDVATAIEAIGDHWSTDMETTAAKPIFLLSAGWRSGSTLLQRLILSGKEALIWGEPYDHCDLVRRMADSLRAIGEEYPPNHFIGEEDRLSDGKAMSGEWVANLYPHPRHMRFAHRAFFRTLYEKPALDVGYARWGFKEVRLGADYAAYLAWLFPDARFLFLYRNPYDAYRSYRRFRGWYDRWPTEPVLTPAQFGRRWRDLAGSFVAEPGLPGASIVRYEDLVGGGGSVVPRIADHLGMSLREDVLRGRIAGAGKGTVKPQAAPRAEIRALRRQVEPLASRLGYRP